MYVCLYVCMYVFMYVCMHACMHVCMYVYIYTWSCNAYCMQSIWPRMAGSNFVWKLLSKSLRIESPDHMRNNYKQYINNIITKLIWYIYIV